MELYISNSGQEPIYAQITRPDQSQNFERRIAAGDALPSIRLLAKELRISVITTKRAYEDLEADGFITTMPGRGSFVAPQNPALHREESLNRWKSTCSTPLMPRGAAALPKTKCAKPLTFCGEEL